MKDSKLNIKYCANCGKEFNYNNSQNVSRCSNCGCLTGDSPNESKGTTLTSCSKCNNEVSFSDRYCKSCGTSLFFGSYEKEAEKSNPSWQCSGCYKRGIETEPPICPKCNKKVRKDNSPRPSIIFGNNNCIPWNSGWKGRCENCGFDFEINLTSFSGFSARSLKITPRNKPYRYFLDEGYVFSGIEISTTDREVGKPADTKKVFLSMGELNQLLIALHKDFKIVLDQYDWSEDGT